MSLDLGPESASGPAASFLEKALAAARLCGVTRLAEITGLDRLGLPVWQAVRPAGRSLSVHQGKGASAQAAMIGALCEAIEAHCAEEAAADGPLCRFSALPRSERAPDIGDYCRTRDQLPEEAQPIQWCRARDYATGRPCYLPHLLVSLDYTAGLPSCFERASSGLGAGSREAAAVQISLLEVIERDAVGQWERLDRIARMATAIQLDSVPFAWFQAWRARFGALGIAVRAFRVESLVGVPAFMCVIGGMEEFGPAYRRFYGTAAHGDPELALFKALAEAIQSRLTLIAGVRDDILPSDYARARPKPVAGRDATGTGRAWDEVEPVDCRPHIIAEGLAALGYPQIAVKRLGGGLRGVAVAKVFIPGLGSSSRTRRVAQ